MEEPLRIYDATSVSRMVKKPAATVKVIPRKMITSFPPVKTAMFKGLSQQPLILKKVQYDPNPVSRKIHVPVFDSTLCFAKCLSIFAARHLVPAIPANTYKKDYSLVQAWASVGRKVIESIFADKQLFDSDFTAICKHYSLVPPENVRVHEIIKEYQSFMCGSGPTDEGVAIMEFSGTAGELHAVYVFGETIHYMDSTGTDHYLHYHPLLREHICLYERSLGVMMGLEDEAVYVSQYPKPSYLLSISKSVQRLSVRPVEIAEEPKVNKLEYVRI